MRLPNAPKPRALLLTELLFMAAACQFAAGQTSAVSHLNTPRNFEGIWNSATATPLERPSSLKDQAFFTPQQAAEWERRARAQSEDASELQTRNGFVTYNAVFREPGLRVLRSMRTSIITDPPNGRIPALTPAAAAERQRREQALRHPRAAKDFGLQDRCLVFETSVPPMLPYGYNSNYQIIQNGDAVMINVEMPHDTRVIHLDRRQHLPSALRLWLGDSIGKWQENTLVVDTTNFNDADGFFGDAGGMRGWDRNLHVIERFSLLDAGTLLYRFEVDDPSAFTRPWKGELTMARSAGPIYEYACHEGNYALPNLLNIFRSAAGSDVSRPSTAKK